tara:strand:- start:180 stop:842 length:663 start_codon:yes stop_codon:yes gene_type:complete
MHLNISLNGEKGRLEIEEFIHKVFANHYGANIQNYLPWLLGIFDQHNELQGALGLKEAYGNRLFLEQYLNDSVEEVASQVINTNINREDIIEVGNLAAVSLGGTRSLIYMLAAFLRGAGYKWVVCTATPLLVKSFERLHIPIYHLADAIYEDLSEGQPSWGSYYRNNPKVFIGNINEGFDVLQKNPNLNQLESTLAWNQAYAKGDLCRVTKNNITSSVVI